MRIQKNSSLKIKDYKLSLYLGVNESERIDKQIVLLSLKIDFKTIPKATATDNIEDTICYYNICDKLKMFNDKAFNTIESLTYEIFEFINDIIKPNLLKLEIDKFPNIENLKGHVSCIIKNGAEWK